MTQEDVAAAKIIWDFLLLNAGEPPVTDIAIVMGTTDIGVAQRSAELWHDELVSKMIFSGYRQDSMTTTEAELFADEARRLGVPEEAMLLETKASNSAENFLLSYKLIENHELTADSITIVCKPYMERRAYAIAMAQWPMKGVQFYFTSQRISFSDYMKTNDTSHVIALMLGNLRRIDEYPAKGWQIPQDIPEDVWAAYRFLEQSWKVRDIKA